MKKRKNCKPFLTKDCIDFEKLNTLEEIYISKLNRSENYDDLENKTYLFRKSLIEGYESSPDASVEFMIDQLEFIETHIAIFFKKYFYKKSKPGFTEGTLTFDVMNAYQNELDFIEAGAFRRYEFI